MRFVPKTSIEATEQPKILAGVAKKKGGKKGPVRKENKTTARAKKKKKTKQEKSRAASKREKLNRAGLRISL